MGTAVACTGMPGKNTFCAPLTITRSPAASPSHDAQPMGTATQFHITSLRQSILVYDVDVVTVVVGQHRLVVDQHGREPAAADQSHAGIEARRENAILVVQHRAHGDRAAAPVHLVVEEVHRAGVREVRLVRQGDLDRQLAASLAGAFSLRAMRE